MNPASDVLEPCGIAVRSGKIVSVGPSDEIQSLFQAEQTLDISGCVALPGLINSHTHAAMTLFRGLADDLSLMDWLQNHIFPAERKLNEEWVYWGTMLACAEMILSGTTAFCDMYLFAHKVAEAAKKAGMRALVGEVLYDFPSPCYGPIENGLKHTGMLIEKWQGDSLIDVAVEPHAIYTCSPDLLKRCIRMSADYDVPLVVHLSENEAEVKQVLELYGKRPVEHLASLGILDRRVVADHCVALDDSDIYLLAANRVKVVHNPESNMKLASGIAPIPRLLEAGVTVALGTDGCASNNNLDMLGEMDSCAKLHKGAALDPRVLSAQQVLQMATVSGAAALGWEGKTGILSPGMAADLIVVDFRKPNLTPSYSPVSHLVYCAGGADVRHSIIDGRLVMKDRTLLTLDLEEILGHVREFAKKIGAGSGERQAKGCTLKGGEKQGEKTLGSSVQACEVGEVDWLLFNADWLIACDPAMSCTPFGAVAIQGKRIVAAGPSGQLRALFRGKKEMDLSGCLLMPGLINTHTHAAMSLFRGVADDLPLKKWLEDNIFPLENVFLSPESVYLGTLLSAVEMLKSGTTCFCDGYFFEEQAARACVKAGIRAILGQGLLDFPTPDAPTPEASQARAEAFLRDFPSRNGRIRPSLFCHSPYTCSPQTLKRTKQLCRSNKILFQTHLAETREEVALIEQKYGVRPGIHLDNLGLLDDRTLCAHAIWMSEQEMHLFAHKGASVAHCPESAMKLGSGVAPVVDMASLGVKVGLGTDGCASNNDLDLFSEAGFAARLHKVFRNDAQACPAREALRMATTGGACALGLQDEIGSIQPGKKADLVALSLEQPHLSPLYDPISHIVYAARGGDVSHVWVDGRLVVKDRQVLTVKEGSVLSDAKRMGERIFSFKSRL
jgi:5-methylthioadenosine/S-adenosylhomocysteine deaminase